MNILKFKFGLLNPLRSHPTRLPQLAYRNPIHHFAYMEERDDKKSVLSLTEKTWSVYFIKAMFRSQKILHSTCHIESSDTCMED